MLLPNNEIWFLWLSFDVSSSETGDLNSWCVISQRLLLVPNRAWLAISAQACQEMVWVVIKSISSKFIWNVLWARSILHIVIDASFEQTQAGFQLKSGTFLRCLWTKSCILLKIELLVNMNHPFFTMQSIIYPVLLWITSLYWIKIGCEQRFMTTLIRSLPF